MTISPEDLILAGSLAARSAFFVAVGAGPLEVDPPDDREFEPHALRARLATATPTAVRRMAEEGRVIEVLLLGGRFTLMYAGRNHPATRNLRRARLQSRP